MLLIADSGSTKTEWMLINNKQLVMQFVTSGFNPYYFGNNAISKILHTELPADLPLQAINNVIYYGSGCSNQYNCQIVSEAFAAVFTKSIITIHHDLLAAAHALLGKNVGIACILGTGSNSCLYDGERIVANVPSLGYLLADEGSGTYIGKKLVTAILYGEAPEAITNDFYSTTNLSFETTLRTIYSSDKPGSLLAGFTELVGKHIHLSFCKNLVASAFDDFIKVHISQYELYQNLSVSFVGSVAFHFSEILQTQLRNAGISPGLILKTPAKGLAAYYGATD
jgi:glucosamine kinase